MGNLGNMTILEHTFPLAEKGRKEKKIHTN